MTGPARSCTTKTTFLIVLKDSILKLSIGRIGRPRTGRINMTHSTLHSLTDDGFLGELGIVGNPRALRSLLRRSEQVQSVRDALASGQVKDESVRKFVEGLLQQLKPNQLFPYDLSLAAIAVLLESRATSFADEYLFDLARLQRPELPMAIRVARECAKVQSQTPSNRTAVCRLDWRPVEIGWRAVQTPYAPQTENQKQVYQLGIA